MEESKKKKKKIESHPSLCLGKWQEELKYKLKGI